MGGISLFRCAVSDCRMWASVALWSVTGGAAILFAVRAALGAFDAPVTAVVPALVTAAAAAGSLGAWELFRQARLDATASEDSSGRSLVCGLLSLISPALLAWATTVNATPFAAGVVTGILVLELTFIVVREGVRSVSPASVVHRHNAGAAEALYFPLPDDSSSERLLVPVVGPDGDLVQQITRRREGDGSERIEAVVSAAFAPGERVTVVHFPIHPVLGGSPHVECEPIDDVPVSAVVTAAYPYGVRVEVTRTTAVEGPLCVPIGLELWSSGNVADVA